MAKVAMREWNLLRHNLPPGIYVQAFEDRIDLFKVLIFGAEGTPYYLTPHVFDIMLPPSYPDKPPLLFYNSRVEKLNPNLYEDGKVCLSLLGTWSGRGVEVWDPARSSLLQVVLSIQGLILGTPQPFFLEAGYVDVLVPYLFEKHAPSF
jgi:ubiquitin-conjugating enzyme E2 O